MPWREVSVMDQRREFVRLALQDGVNRRELCRRFAISADIGYKWLGRWVAGDSALGDRAAAVNGPAGRARGNQSFI
jgi:transposase-like protein